MANCLNLTRLDCRIALRCNRNAFGIDVAIASRARISGQAVPGERRNTFALRRRKGQYYFLEFSDRIHDAQYSARGIRHCCHPD